MYQCMDCGSKFEHPEIHRSDSGVRADGGFSEIIYMAKCPHCGSGDMKQFDLCPQCGDDRGMNILCQKCCEELCDKFRHFVAGLTPPEREQLDDLLDGTSIMEV